MNKAPIIIVAGEPNSIFLEIFFKSLKKYDYKSPLIIIASKKLVQQQMKKLGFTLQATNPKQKVVQIFGLPNTKPNKKPTAAQEMQALK